LLVVDGPSYDSSKFFPKGLPMKRSYESPLVIDLGSVSEMTRQMTGVYGEFVLPGQDVTGMMMPRMMMG
jgi:hypothetical protein